MYGPSRGHVSPNPIISYALHKQNGLPMSVDFRCPESSCTSSAILTHTPSHLHHTATAHMHATQQQSLPTPMESGHHMCPSNPSSLAPFSQCLPSTTVQTQLTPTCCRNFRFPAKTTAPSRNLSQAISKCSEIGIKKYMAK